MALTALQKLAYEQLIQQWAEDQRLNQNNPTPLVTLAFATQAQVKNATLAFLNTRKAQLQEQQANYLITRPQQDAKTAADISDIDAIVTELG